MRHPARSRVEPNGLPGNEAERGKEGAQSREGEGPPQDRATGRGMQQIRACCRMGEDGRTHPRFPKYHRPLQGTSGGGGGYFHAGIISTWKISEGENGRGKFRHRCISQSLHSLAHTALPKPREEFAIFLKDNNFPRNYPPAPLCGPSTQHNPGHTCHLPCPMPRCNMRCSLLSASDAPDLGARDVNIRCGPLPSPGLVYPCCFKQHRGNGGGLFKF